MNQLSLWDASVRVDLYNRARGHLGCVLVPFDEPLAMVARAVATMPFLEPAAAKTAEVSGRRFARAGDGAWEAA